MVKDEVPAAAVAGEPRDAQIEELAHELRATLNGLSTALADYGVVMYRGNVVVLGVEPRRKGVHFLSPRPQQPQHLLALWPGEGHQASQAPVSGCLLAAAGRGSRCQGVHWRLYQHS